MDPVQALSELKYNIKSGKTGRRSQAVFGKTGGHAEKIKELKPAQAQALLKYHEHIKKNPDKTMGEIYEGYYPNFDDETAPLAQTMSLRYANIPTQTDSTGKTVYKATKVKKYEKTSVGADEVKLARPDMQSFFEQTVVAPVLPTAPVGALNKNKKLLKQQALSDYIEKSISPHQSYTAEQIDKIKKEMIAIQPNLEKNPQHKKLFENIFLPLKVIDDPRSNPLNIQGQTKSAFDIDEQAMSKMLVQPEEPNAPQSNMQTAMVFDADKGFKNVIPPDLLNPETSRSNPYKGSTAIDPLKFDGMIPPNDLEQQTVPEPEKTESGEIINANPRPIKKSLEEQFEHEGKPQPKKPEIKRATSPIAAEVASYVSAAQQEQVDANALAQSADDKLIGDRYRVGLGPQQSRAAADLILKPRSVINKSINTFSNLNWVYSRQNSFLGNASSLKKMDDIETKMRFGTVYAPIARQPCSRLTDTLKNKKFLSTLSDPLEPRSDVDTSTLLKSVSTGSADLDDQTAPRTFTQPPNMGKIAGMENKYATFNDVRLFNKIGDMNIIRNTNKANTFNDNVTYPDIKIDNKDGRIIFS